MRIAALLAVCLALVLALVALPHPRKRLPMDREVALAKLAELAKRPDLETRYDMDEVLYVFYSAIRKGDSIAECEKALAEFEKPQSSHGTRTYMRGFPVKGTPPHPDGTGLLLYVEITEETLRVESTYHSFTSD